jgi:hypothetical protein
MTVSIVPEPADSLEVFCEDKYETSLPLLQIRSTLLYSFAKEDYSYFIEIVVQTQVRRFSRLVSRKIVEKTRVASHRIE